MRVPAADPATFRLLFPTPKATAGQITKRSGDPRGDGEACDGLAGLARQSRADRGRRRVPGDLRGLVEGLALERPRRSVAAIHRRASAVAAERGWPVPSYGCVYAIVRRLNPALVTLAHEGPKAYGERYELLHRREAVGPNAIWQADHTQLDCWVLDEHGHAARP